MIYKLTGASIVLLSTTLLGYIKSNSYSKRVQYLEDMLICVTQLESEIQYTQTPISIALKKISRSSHGVIGKVFSSVGERLENTHNLTLAAIWDSVICEFEHIIAKEDIDFFKQLGKQLGSSDIEGEQKNINLFKAKLSQLLVTANKESEKNGKLFRSLGIYSGLLISVLFL